MLSIGKQKSSFPCYCIYIIVQFSSVQSLSHVRLYASPWITAGKASLFITISWSFYPNSCPLNRWCHPSISSLVIPFSSCPQSFPALGSFPASWSFSLSISPSNECSGLISFMIDCFDLLAVQGTLKSLLQHHCSKASVLQHSAFFMVQFSHLYMTTGKTMILKNKTY